MSMIAFRIEDSLSFQDTKWIELKPLIFLYGENSSGKSNIHLILQTLKHSIIHQSNATTGLPFTLRNFQSLIPYDKTQTNDVSITISFRFNIMDRVIDSTSVVSKQPIDLKIVFKQIDGLDEATISEFSLETTEVNENSNQVILHGKIPKASNSWTLNSEHFHSALDDNVSWPEVQITYSFPPQLIGITKHINDITKIYIAKDEEGRDLLDENNEPIYINEDVSENVRFAKDSIKFISNILEQMQIELSDLFENYNYIPAFQHTDAMTKIHQADIEEWIRYILGDKKENSAPENQRGIGYSKIINIIQIISTLRQNSVCFLEHPDAFLAEKTQGDFMDFLISMTYKRNIIFIIESHSEIFLLRLRKRVKQFYKNRPTPTILSDLDDFIKAESLFCRTCIIHLKKDVFGNSKPTTLHLNTFGDFQEIPFWPDNLFETAFKEKLLLHD
ncbi:MAG: AAA family ATPase [Anaerolineales bacterium]|nr:MAG: AAA family ATPase [Anaerolineales bacterium]